MFIQAMRSLYFFVTSRLISVLDMGKKEFYSETHHSSTTKYTRCTGMRFNYFGNVIKLAEHCIIGTYIIQE